MLAYEPRERFGETVTSVVPVTNLCRAGFVAVALVARYFARTTTGAKFAAALGSWDASVDGSRRPPFDFPKMWLR